ncbi:hypothetical protein [Candidatus Palauibacter sp.]|uniref:hypothetical protein n=1 Tax=Candidatus Palauibacter sp. TaxID=3101350 RepID=UPI003AF2EEA2
MSRDSAAILAKLRNNPRGVRFSELSKLNAKGMAKPYQVRQVIKAIEKLEGTT